MIRSDPIRPAYPDAHQVMADLAPAGIDMDDVVEVLEVEAVEKFETSWTDLIASTKSELERLAKEADAGATGAGE